MPKFRTVLRKIWHFVWEDNSVLSWIVNIIIAFVLVKFVIYPGLGFLLSTSHPVVAVVSSSMEHDDALDKWWEENKGFYEGRGISFWDFENYSFEDGFNKGDIIVLKGSKGINIGDVIVYNSNFKDPIIHRVVEKNVVDAVEFYTTKGDNNGESFDFEKGINKNQIIGKAIFKIPLLGWVKIYFTKLIGG